MDLLDTYSYNLRVAQVFGINSAVFITCLNEEYNYQARVSKTGEVEDHIALSRSEIYGRTAIDDEKQKQVEEALVACGVISMKPLQNVANKYYYVLNKEIFKKIIEAEDPSKVLTDSKAKEFVKKKRVEPKSKRQLNIEKLKKSITAQDPVVKQYLVDWIDSVFAKPRGFLSPASIRIAEEELVGYSKGNQEKQIGVMKIAIKGGWRDLTWAIKKYEELNPPIASRNFGEYSDMQVDKSQMSDEAF